ncbi:hypothetical protein BP5796_01813 [Coleophoma crateriformis]|uniref:SnoaL-like domain-containing protein n=1 Tax=Coleophoma crateriformis TaxID=565419 RepID=A0A3D8T1P5_9HELO|nr:hypothetical protein BP5796_01813 [Coleophoma crateriformis]
MKSFSIPFLLVGLAYSCTTSSALPQASGIHQTESFCPPRAATPEEQRSIFATFSQKFYVDKNVSAALNDHLADDYIQHNPAALSGKQAALDALVPIFGLFETTIVHSAFENGTGWVHYKLVAPGATNANDFSAVVDVFRMNGSCIQEHWDVAQQRPANATNLLALF